MPIRDTIVPLASSRTLGSVALYALLLGLYSVLPIWKEYSRFRDLGDTPSDVHAALSLILGLLPWTSSRAAAALRTESMMRSTKVLTACEKATSAN